MLSLLNKPVWLRAWLWPFAMCAVLAGCMQPRWSQPPPSRYEPSADSAKRSERGNPPFYEVFGRRYYVMDASANYNERGVASWYGKKFHGRQTSNGEIYDMHAMTAAHKTLPLPTRVRVTNLQNGRSIIVRVNDRGPFVDNRIIDLSYAAASKLGMVRAGTAMVEVSALPENRPVVTAAATAEVEPQEPRKQASNQVYLQVGAFGDQANARQLQAELQASGFSNVVIHYNPAETAALHRVRLGPIGTVTEYDQLVRQVAALHIVETHLVTESGSTNIVTRESSGI